MQPKVSIVIPCYNKAKWISNMFDSIIAQKWNNIELIIVNDGSTDGTTDIINEYEPKFIKRGFEIVIVKQENQGVAASVCNGLKKITGEYVCQVDADDELSDEYVLELTGFLENNSGYDWAVCDMLFVYQDKKEAYHSYFNSDLPEDFILSDVASSFLSRKIIDTVHEYMVRTSYLKRAKVIDNYFYEKRRTQEPQWVLPLAVLGGKLKHIPKPLYRYAQYDEQFSTRKTYGHYDKYADDYYAVVNETIRSLECNADIKRKFFVLMQIGLLKSIYINALRFGIFNRTQKMNVDVINLIGSVFKPKNRSLDESPENMLMLLSAAEDRIHKITPKKTNIFEGRTVAWGALGVYGRYLLYHLRKTSFYPDEVWDLAGDGNNIKKPNPESLTKNNTVIVMPFNQFAVAGINAKLVNCGCRIIHFEEIATFVHSLLLPEFYDESIKFVPREAE